MRIAVDTNVFSAMLSGDPDSAPQARAALEDARMEGMLAVSPAVYAELAAGRTTDAVDEFFSGKGIEVDWEMDRGVWRTAGSRYGAYAGDRRRRKRGSAPRRILADFLMGAHALHLARALLTAYTGIYGKYFPELRVVAPLGSPADTAGW